MVAAALSALLLSAAPRLEAAVSAGGGYDSNLNNADPSVAAVGSGFGAVRASGGASLDLGSSTDLYAGARFDDEEYPAYPDLTTRTAGVDLSLVQALGERAAVVLTPWISRSWAGDPARDATTLAGQLTLRVKPARDLALRGFYGHTSRTAEDPVYSSERDRIGASIEWRVLRRTYLSLAAWAERGDEVFYRPTGAGGGAAGMGRMGRGGAFGGGEEPYRASATSRAIGPALEIGLDRTFHLLASYELRVVGSGVAADVQTQSAFVGLGARL
jgi:hypothetical protein